MATPCKNAEAVNELLRIADPDYFIENLTDMWETWVTSDLTDSATASMRADRLITYKTLCEMLRKISREDLKSC